MPETISWHGFGIALTLVGAGVLAGFLAMVTVRALTQWRGRGPSAARAFSTLARWGVTLLFVGAAVTVLFPSVKPVDMLGGVTVISIAAGIAFQTVLGNMFAGLVILTRDQYRAGDQVAVGEMRGQIVRISFTSTTIRTFDGRLVVVPNSQMHDEMVTVQTGFEKVRSAVLLQIVAGQDPHHACTVAQEAAGALDVVLEKPTPQAYLTEVSDGNLLIELRFWSGARQLDTVEARDAVLRAVLEAYRTEEIELYDGSVTISRPTISREE